MFTYLVDFKNSNPDKITKSYEGIYSDVRHSVDLCHKDGYIKDTVMQNPERYIIYDEALVPMLTRMKESGKKVFLLTNSMWEYTNRVMEYLVHGK
ncbi:hypothetical protein EON65_08310 [archaeon]|nr:MAG: hypothetical protein EON65_08310 [archaeon]